MKVVENENFVVKETWDDTVAIGNLKTFGEGMYIDVEQVEDLIDALKQYAKQK